MSPIRPAAPAHVARRSTRAVQRCLTTMVAWTIACAIALVGLGQVVTSQLRSQPAEASSSAIETADPAAARPVPREQRGAGHPRSEPRPTAGVVPTRAMVATTGVEASIARSGAGLDAVATPTSHVVLPTPTPAGPAGPVAEQLPRPLPVEAITQRGPPQPSVA